MQPSTLTKFLLFSALLSLITAQQTSCQSATNQTQGPASIIVGPIIGKVTTTTARVLLEFDTEGPITVILTDPAGNQTKSRKNVTASIPIPFSFEGLQPNTSYNVSLSDPNISMIESYFTTLSGESGKLNFVVLSCNDRGIQSTKEPEADLWADLLKRIQNKEIHYLLQTGDQVYMDDPFGNSNASKPYYNISGRLNTTSRDAWNNSRQEFLELLRDEYRNTWSIPSIRETLAKIPQLTILDDHNVRDDWGYLPEDRDPDSSEYFYGTLARQVYYEYERQLREDVDFTDLSNITQEYYYETLNDIGFFFLDYRGVRTWNRPYSQIGTTQLGVNQTQLLQQVLDPNGGAFANLTNFFLVSPLTVVFLVEALVKIGYYNNNDAEESWTYGYKDEQAQLLDTLRNWKLAKPGRAVTILDGDLHMGGYTDISYGDDVAFLQFTSSSIASSAPSDAVFYGFEALKEIQDLVDPWTYEHHDWTNEFNYGIVLNQNKGDNATVACYLVEAPADDEPKIIGADGDEVDSDGWQEALGFASQSI